MAAAVRPDRILRQLDELWVSLGHDTDGGDSVLRACSMTLIVAEEGESADVGETLAPLMRDHPSRAIVLRLVPGETPSLDAQVTAQCWRPLGKQQQICCEQIEVRFSAPSFPSVPAAVHPLAASDLPVAVWIRSQSLLQRPEFPAISSLGDKLIVDSQRASDLRAQWQAIEAASATGVVVADLAWTRLTRWRESIAQFFDDPAGRDRAASIGHVVIGFEGPHAPMSAYYLMAWFRHSLGARVRLSIVKTGDSPVARVQSISLAGPGIDESISVAQDRGVNLKSAVRGARGVFPRLTEYELMREELSVAGRDDVFEDVRRHVPEFLQ